MVSASVGKGTPAGSGRATTTGRKWISEANLAAYDLLDVGAKSCRGRLRNSQTARVGSGQRTLRVSAHPRPRMTAGSPIMGPSEEQSCYGECEGFRNWNCNDNPQFSDQLGRAASVRGSLFHSRLATPGSRGPERAPVTAGYHAYWPDEESFLAVPVSAFKSSLLPCIASADPLSGDTSPRRPTP